jgi:flagellar FliL protein
MTDIVIEDAPQEAAEPKKKKKRGKKLLLLILFLLVIGGGAAGGYYAVYGGGGHEAEAEDPNQPQLVVREGVSDEAAAEARQRARGRNGRPDPRVFQATYIPLEGNFTSNLRGGDAFVQISIGVSTHYDSRVGERLTAHNMAIRSAILTALSEADPVAITTSRGKEELKETLRNAINNVLTNREGFGGIDEVYFTSFVTQ